MCRSYGSVASTAAASIQLPRNPTYGSAGYGGSGSTYGAASATYGGSGTYGAGAGTQNPSNAAASYGASSGGYGSSSSFSDKNGGSRFGRLAQLGVLGSQSNAAGSVPAALPAVSAYSAKLSYGQGTAGFGRHKF